MKLNAILTLIMYQSIPSDCKSSYVTYLFNASLNLFLSPDKSLIVFGKWRKSWFLGNKHLFGIL